MKNSSKITVQQLEKMSDVQLAGINLDDVNFLAYNTEVNKRSKLATISQSNKGMFRYTDTMTIKDKKVLRTKSRKIRNTFFESINNANLETTNTNTIKFVKSFITFYKATYLLNDFSTESCIRPNSDKNTLAKGKTALHICKLFQSGKIK